MTEEKMKYYNALRQPPPEALKQIQGGRISGKTDVNPQYRYKAMTEQFGPCGVGWKYNIEKLWLEPADNGQVCAFSLVNVWVKVDGEWSEPIPGIGGSMLTEQEKAGLHVSDECFKMATTDALSVALKMLGVAADIYAGAWDGSRYKDQSAKPAPEATKSTEKPPTEETISKPQEEGRLDPDWLAETLGIIHWSEKTALSWIKSQMKVPADGSLNEVLNSLDATQLKVFVDHISSMRESSGK